jgi:hypothetical protein
MAVRPPQGDDDEPDAIEFGIAALDARLDAADLSFPATADEIVQRVPNTDIPYDASGRTVPLGEALERVPQQRFESESELLDVLHPVFEEYRVSASNGIFTQLRDLLPF